LKVNQVSPNNTLIAAIVYLAYLKRNCTLGTNL